MSHPLPNQSFGKYQILERIAAGGTAEVFKARLEGIGGFQRTFAIKRIRPGLSQNRDYIETLVDEAKIAGLLSHANIVQILDLGQVNGLYYVAMEYVDGEDLGTVLSRCTAKGITFPVPHAIFVCLELLKGLEYAHSRSILRGNREVPLQLVHRDLSPSNILLSFQGEVKLTDFGIARANAEALAGIPSLARGRYDYMSPEQIEGSALDRRSDIFAVGVVLYEMLCGVHPFRRGDNQRTMEAVRSGEYEPPTMTNPDVPYGLELILEQALCREAEQRFSNSTEFKGALNKFFHDSGFIFSQSTLAAFLKGLFPKIDLARRQGIFHEDETRPLHPSDMMDGPAKRAWAHSQALGEEDMETAVESAGESAGDPDTLEASILNEGGLGEQGNVTLARSIPDEEEPTKAMAVPQRPPAGVPSTLVGARVDVRDMLLRDHEEPDDWDDAQATEVWNIPAKASERTEAGEVEEKTLVGGPAAQAQARGGQVDVPTQPWEQDSPPGTPRIEKRTVGGRQSRDAPTLAPPEAPGAGRDPAHDDVEIDEDPQPTNSDVDILAPTPTLAPMDDAGFPGAPNLRARRDSPTLPIPRPPGASGPERAPGPDGEVIAEFMRPPPPAPPSPAPFRAASPLPSAPETEPMPPDEPAPDSVAQAVAEQMASDAAWRQPPESQSRPSPEPAAPAAPTQPIARPPETADSAGPPKKATRLSRAIAFMSAAIALAGTLAGGFTLGVAAMLDRNPEIEQPVTLKSEPRLTANLPADARLFVDEREVPVTEGGPTEVTLAPGVPTRVRVEMDGYVPHEQTLTLDYNDLRVLAFEVVGLAADGQ